MSQNPDQASNLFRSTEIADAESEHSHPWNPKSLLRGTHLSRLGGLERTGVSLVRIPPGHESFTYHLHHFEEEWIYILSGTATAEIDDQELHVGPGDFMAFPAPSVGHHLRNTGNEELVYLMGGENRECEVGPSVYVYHGSRFEREGRGCKAARRRAVDSTAKPRNAARRGLPAETRWDGPQSGWRGVFSRSFSPGLNHAPSGLAPSALRRRRDCARRTQRVLISPTQQAHGPAPRRGGHL